MKKVLSSLLIISALTINMSVVVAQSDNNNTSAEAQSYTIVPLERNAIKPNQTILELRPGQTHQEVYVIENLSDAQIELINYGADSTSTHDGQFTIKDKNDDQENIGKWLNIEEGTITIEPLEKTEITATITIPEDTEIGTYTGGITTEKINEKVGNVRVSTRIALIVNITVTDDPQPIPMLAKQTQTNIFAPTPYFWASVLIFLSSISYFFYANKKEKKKRENQV